MTDFERRLRMGLMGGVLLLAMLAAALYLPMLRAGLVYDDRPQILYQEYIHDLGNLPEVITFRVLGRDVLDFNRPVNILSLMIDAAFWKKNPAGYHLTNILLHSANTAMVFLFLVAALGMAAAGPRPGDKAATGGPGSSQAARRAGAWFAALLFAVHPLMSEAVCSPAFREDLLVAFFVLAALLLASRLPARSAGAGAGIAFLIALCLLLAAGSKESGIAGPPIVLAFCLLKWRTGLLRQRALVAAIAAGFVAVGAFLVARFALQPENSVIFRNAPSYVGGSFRTMMLIQPRIWTVQLMQLVYPAGLCADYGEHCLRFAPLALALVALPVLAIAWLIAARKYRAVLLAGAIYILAILPVSNLVPIYRPMADRYMYLPMIGFALLAAWLLDRVAAFCATVRSVKALSTAAAAVWIFACVILAAQTLERQRVWSDPLRLWADASAKNPRSPTAANNHAQALFDSGKTGEAIREFERALALSGRRDPKVWFGLAAALELAGRPEEARRAREEAARIDERFGDPARLREALIIE